MAGPDIIVPCRLTIKNQILKKYTLWKDSFVECLESIQFVCQTADIWSTRTKSYMGVTIHWIDENLHRQARVLACRRFPGIHSYDNIAKLLNEINTEFKIPTSKIVATVTDNASNFIKAFREFGVELVLPSLDNNENEIDADEMDEDVDDLATVRFLNILPELDEDEQSQSSVANFTEESNDFDGSVEDLTLSQHQRCAVHGLNLIPTTDIKNCLKKNRALASITSKTMKKLSKLWNAGGRPKSAETMKRVLGCAIKRPGNTRWNSLFDCLDQIVELDWPLVDEIMVILGYPTLSLNEKVFVKDYLSTF